MPKTVTRLFKNFAPHHYDLSISLSEDKQTFQGFVTIHGKKTGRPSKRLTFHQKGLTITNPIVEHTDKKGSKSDVPIIRVNSHASYDEIRIHSETLLFPGEYCISMQFSGVITKNMDGIYPCFFEEKGVNKTLIATQFESHHAREVFPCIDEPEAKATFQLTLEHNAAEIALSNTTAISEKRIEDNRTQTVFDITPLMSTYLLAFVAGEMKYVETASKSGVKIRVFSTPGHIAETAFALEEAAQYMDFYENYYDIPFPLKKCDFVALPDFASGAMENWGLITFREQTLLVSKKTSLITKQYVAIVIAHELTHQWFGNLVTMRWWTDLWLNEGFASWMEYLAVDTYHPDWKLWTQFAVDDQQLALGMDALEHTHPIEVPVRHPDEIRSIFDTISYNKGASVIHMLHDFLGAEDFKNGLRHYLSTHAYKNTDTLDLWRALEFVSNKPVADFMQAWTTQAGFPLLRVNHDQDHIHITQERFVTNPQSKARQDTGVWPVPLGAKNIDQPVLLNKSKNIQLSDKKTPPLKLNLGQTGFYRVVYDAHLQDQQKNVLKNASERTGTLDRMGLLSDSFETTRAGYQSTREYLELLEYYKNENSLPVWDIISGSIGSIRKTLSSNNDITLRTAMKPFVCRLVALQLKRLTIHEPEQEEYLDTLLRPIIVGLAAAADHEQTVHDLLQRYKDTMQEGKEINPNLRGIIYCTAARKGDDTEFEQLFNRYISTQSVDEKLSITAGLTSFEQPRIHDKVLRMITSDNVKLQDVIYWVGYSLSNRFSRDMTWRWFQENWDWLSVNLGSDLSFSRFPVYVAQNFTEEKQLEQYMKFFSSRVNPSIERAYKQGIEIIETNVAWKKRDGADVLKWFISRQD